MKTTPHWYYSVPYAQFTPGLLEKTIIGMNQQPIVCPDRGNRSNRIFGWSKIRN